MNILINIFRIRHISIPPFTIMDFVITIVTSMICFIISIYAYKGYLVIKEKSLFNLNLAFTLIGSGLLIEAITIILAISSREMIVLLLGDYTSMLTQIIGYSLIIYTYYKPARIEEVLPALIFISGTIGYLLNIIIIIILTFIVSRLIVNFTMRKSLGSSLSLASFILIDLSHILIAINPYRISVLVTGEIVRLIGFILLAILLYVTSREGK